MGSTVVDPFITILPAHAKPAVNKDAPVILITIYFFIPISYPPINMLMRNYLMKNVRKMLGNY
jgi:hypothetical protein